jgi:UDPglucose 6-dehydrogenase
MQRQKISVIGLGFVGLSLAVVNASKGFNTIAIDINKEKIQKLKSGMADFYEPNLENYLRDSIKTEKIQFTDNLSSVLKTDITFLTVGTPSEKNGGINLSYLKKASVDLANILRNKKGSHLVVIKSTVIPTTTLKEISPKFKNLRNTSVVVNPEFLREGSAIKDLLDPHLIVIGEKEKADGDKLVRYYEVFYGKKRETVRTDWTTAEMIKYANNVFLAMKISFINSMANLCQNIPGTDVSIVAKAIGKDIRIGPLFLNAGPGFGGSCLPKDLSALIEFSNKFDTTNRLFREIKKVNEEQPFRIISIMKNMGLYHSNTTISILGLAFKKNTDDIREAISIKLVRRLIKDGLKIKVHDPMAINNFRTIFGKKISYHTNLLECIQDSDCCIILTEWDIYKTIKVKDLKRLMKTRNLIDARRILDPKKFTDFNFRAIGLGK